MAATNATDSIVGKVPETVRLVRIPAQYSKFYFCPVDRAGTTNVRND